MKARQEIRNLEEDPTSLCGEASLVSRGCGIGVGISPSKRILVPIDFSTASRRALQYAVRLAKQFGASLTLLHVVSAKTTASSGADYLLLEKELKARGNEQLTGLVQKFLGNDVTANMMVRIGNPAIEIVHAAEDLDANLIIISRHPAGRHLLHGSVAKAVARHSSCPVLVVHKDDNPALYCGGEIVGNQWAEVPKPCVVAEPRCDYPSHGNN